MSNGHGRANRVALALFGVVLLGVAVWVSWARIAGLLGLGVSESVEQTWAADPGRRVLDVPGQWAEEPWFAVLLLAAGVLLLVLAVSWLIKQLPRVSRAGTLKLAGDPATGVTLMQPQVLENALKNLAEEHPAVRNAQVQLQGSATAPGLEMRVMVEPWARLPEISQALDDSIVPAVHTVLGHEPHCVAVNYVVARKAANHARTSSIHNTATEVNP